jgi:hypothetical protein
MIEQVLSILHLEEWRWLLPWLFGLSVIVFIGSIVIGWFVLIRLPEDYLTRDHSTKVYRFKSKLVNLVIEVVRNLFGVAFLVLGVVMLFTPGQGILSIIVGIELVEFPGKQKLIRKILAYPKVLKAINKLRTKANKPPLRPVSDSIAVAS